MGSNSVFKLYSCGIATIFATNTTLSCQRAVLAATIRYVFQNMGCTAKVFTVGRRVRMGCADSNGRRVTTRKCAIRGRSSLAKMTYPSIGNLPNGRNPNGVAGTPRQERAHCIVMCFGVLVCSVPWAWSCTFVCNCRAPRQKKGRASSIG